METGTEAPRHLALDHTASGIDAPGAPAASGLTSVPGGGALGLRFMAASLARPFISRLPSGSHMLYSRLAGTTLTTRAGDTPMRARLRDPVRVMYDRRIGANVIVDLRDCIGRAHYFTGRYYEQTVPLAVRRFLPRRGAFIDVGANRGLHALFAAQYLAPAGQVVAFEPDPNAFRVLDAHMTMNGIRNCTYYHAGLSDREDTLSLAASEQSVLSSFRESAGGNSVDVPVHMLDNKVDPATLDGPVLVKIDVEGFEHKVIRGMPRLLEYPDLVTFCEITDQWLRDTGTSAAELFDEMQGRGFRTYLCELGYSRRLTPRLTLQLLRGPLPGRFQYDVLFTRAVLPV